MDDLVRSTIHKLLSFIRLVRRMRGGGCSAQMSPESRFAIFGSGPLGGDRIVQFLLVQNRSGQWINDFISLWFSMEHISGEGSFTVHIGKRCSNALHPQKSSFHCPDRMNFGGFGHFSESIQEHYTGKSPCEGELDEVQVWSKALSIDDMRTYHTLKLRCSQMTMTLLLQFITGRSKVVGSFKWSKQGC